MNSDAGFKTQWFSKIVNILLLLLYIVSALYLAFGLSANSNAFDSPDTFIVLMFLVITLPHAGVGILALIKRGRNIKLLHLSGILGVLLIFGGFAIGVNNTRILEQETKQSGDILLNHLGEFVSKNGYCPRTLTELAETGVTIPEPSIRHSRFALYAYQKTCTLSFPVDSWITCKKNIPDANEEGWYCAD